MTPATESFRSCTTTASNTPNFAPRGRLGDYCVACVEAFDQGRPNPIHADDDRVVRCDCFRPIPEPEEEEQKEGEPT